MGTFVLAKWSLKSVKMQLVRHYYLGGYETDPRPGECLKSPVLLYYALEMCRYNCNQHSEAQISRTKLAQFTTCLGLVGDRALCCARSNKECEQGGNKLENPTLYGHRKCWSDSLLPYSGEHGITKQTNESQQQSLSLLSSPGKTGCVSGRWFLKWTRCFT